MRNVTAQALGARAEGMGAAGQGARAEGVGAAGQDARRKMELLAPAGGMEQLQAAVRFGADAVYLAADRFGMRARAANFSMDEIPAAVAFAHAAGVKVHVTCNILMHQDDIAELPAYFRALAAAGVDAFIISDLGAAALARECAPQVQLHVSTQASVANAAAARVWYGLGARRIVLAREMSLAQIAAMRRELPEDLEIEAFVHGAMCMAVSGRCLISSYLTGRSGNKGHCTQPCRWHYDLQVARCDGESREKDLAPCAAPCVPDDGYEFVLEEDKRPGVLFPVEEDGRGTYLMNAKDLNMLAHLDELAAAGVDSIKIEGRNKKAFYVASVVNAYRNVLDGGDAQAFARELLDISHRPYGTGFYFASAEQACDYDGYEQNTLHVADVLAVERCAGDGAGYGALDAASCAALDGAPGGELDAAPSAALDNEYIKVKVTAKCRNRFAEGDALEALVPHASPFPVTVRNLRWLGLPDALDATLLPVDVPVANRSANGYTFECTLSRAQAQALVPGSFLRVRRFRRSAREFGKER